MFGIGMPEMILILAVALIVFGPKKLPDLAKSVGRALGEFKKATNEFKESISMDSTLNEVKGEFEDIKKKVQEPFDSSSTTDKKTPEDESTSKTDETGPETTDDDAKGTVAFNYPSASDETTRNQTGTIQEKTGDPVGDLESGIDTLKSSSPVTTTVDEGQLKDA